MELRQLEYFVAVVDDGGFTRAAERLLVAQPGISAQVKNLERELGAALLTRLPRGVALTAAGEAFLPQARATLAAVAGGRAAVDELAGLLRGRLAVGMLSSSSGMGMPRLLREFRDRAPDVEITVTEDDAEGLLRRVREGTLDVAWVATPDVGLPDLEEHPVAEELLAAVVAPAHRWIRRRRVTLAELTAEPLVTTPRGGAVRTVLEDACAAAGLRTRIDIEANSPVLVANLAAEGLGVGVVPASLAGSLDSVHTLRIVEPELRSRVRVVWRGGAVTAPATRAFVDLLRE